jgi:thioredoxin-like negative regulator of GroEL
MSFEVQAAALGLTGAAVGLTAVAARLTAWHARRRAVGEVGTSKAGEHPSTSAPYILYFTTEQCSTCRLLQEPALEKIAARVQKVDAIAERELAERFAIFTVPSTVVIGANGTAANVNYGYADAAKLRRQLTAAG